MTNEEAQAKIRGLGATRREQIAESVVPFPMIPPGVDGNAVMHFAWGCLKAEFRNRPRALNAMARALAAGIEDAQAHAGRLRAAQLLADDDTDAFDRAFVR